MARFRRQADLVFIGKVTDQDAAGQTSESPVQLLSARLSSATVLNGEPGRAYGSRDLIEA